MVRWGWLFIVAAVVASSILASIASSAAGSAEMYVATVLASPDVAGSALALFIPFNYSVPPTYGYVYAIRETPSYVHLFSSMPALLILFEPSVQPTAVYRVVSAPENPYSSFNVPYTSGVFAAYDDFDFPSGMWVSRNTVVAGGSAAVGPGGWLVLNASVYPMVATMWNVLGRSALRLTFTEPGSYVVEITEEVFQEWALVVDGSDVYFTDEYGRPIRYGILSLDKSAKYMAVYVETPTNTVYMFYGGVNPYSSFRLFLYTSGGAQ